MRTRAELVGLVLVAALAACSPAEPAATTGTTTATGSTAATAGGAGGEVPSSVPGTTACEPGTGTDYTVGPNGDLAAINDVPWESLGPGDSVRIEHRAEPYHEKIFISTSGTAEAPIVVCGIAGPNGERPVLDGDGATLRAEHPTASEGRTARSLVLFSLSDDQDWGDKPRHVVLAGLDVSGAHPDNTYVEVDGSTVPYADNAAGVWIERGEDITIRDLAIHGNANGLFVSTGDEEAVVSREILVEGNHIHGNGVVGSDRVHNVYTEADGITFQFNRIDPLLEGAGGGALKDRSAGTVIRFNRIEGGARTLDLVDAEGGPLLPASPRYRDTYVYGNVLVSRAGHATRTVHYGGDSGDEANYRKGTLHFFHNTVVHQADKEGREDTGARWESHVLQLDTADEHADVFGNILVAVAATPGATPTTLTLMDSAGTATVGPNLVSAGFEEWDEAVEPDGEIEGWDQLVTLDGDDAGFVDLDAGDFGLAAGSPAIDLGGPPDAVPGHAVDHQYADDPAGRDRPVAGAAPDLGALERAGG